MRDQQDNRRDFLRNSLYSAAGLAMFPQLTPNAYGSIKTVVAEQPFIPVAPSRIKFAVIGMNHGHIYGQVEAVTRGGGELVSFFAKEADLAAAFAKRYPNAKQAKSEAEILDDDLAALGIREGTLHRLTRIDLEGCRTRPEIGQARSCTAAVVAGDVG